MLTRKLFDNEITTKIISDMIISSMQTYNSLIQKKMNTKENREALMAFISDDIYEFDSISRFAKVMIDMDIRKQEWINISVEIRKYNNMLNENEKLGNALLEAKNYYDEKSEEFNFINKIIKSTYKTGVTLKQTKIREVNDKINVVENKLLHDCNELLPQITLKQAEIGTLSEDVIHKYFDEHNKCYQIPLDKNLYNLCHKCIPSSEIRKKIDDTVHEAYQKNIPKLMYLFIYKHVKANILGYDNYINYLTKYTPSTIQNILNSIIIELGNRCELEINILSRLKEKSEHNKKIGTWDIAYYANQWKMLYGVNEEEIAQYFCVKQVLPNIMNVLSSYFPFTFSGIDKYKKWTPELETYKIMNGNLLVGEVTFDLFARQNKLSGTKTICVSNRCVYPLQKKNTNFASIIVSMNLERKEENIISLNDLISLFNEFGKILFYVSCNSKFSLFGGMYAEVESIETVGKFTELLLFDKKNLKKISHHVLTGEKIPNELCKKIIGQRKLDFGLSYKYQCLYGLYDLFVHSQKDFINDCRDILKINNPDIQKKTLLERMYLIYNKFYSAIFVSNTGEVAIQKDEKHFHPILWAYLFNGNENINFLKILSDIYAHELYQMSGEQKSQFIKKFVSFIESNPIDLIGELDKFIGRQPSILPMVLNFGLHEDDMLLSLYNVAQTDAKCEKNKKPVEKKIEKNKTKTESLYLSPDTHKANHFEQVSESDPMIKQMISKIMR